ncbi:MAG TPA: nitrilase-related carbon-nitrogen hydrolase [Streptosporangiaceae bacterium]|nr:nitrilase-related carbon-nitrogen hydrolase [Streptosporangiaceae bacterium]
MRAAFDNHLVRVAACQVGLAVGKVVGNRSAALRAALRAADEGARIIVLPELTPSGYVFESAAEARALAEPADGPTVTEWADLAARRHLVIVGGFAELGADGQVYNSSVLADPAGVRAVYRKVHLWDAESDFFVPGSEPPPVVDTEFGRIAMMVCYDVEFPEWVRRPALAGADLLAVPTNWPADPVPPGERPMVVANVQAAAFANRMFVAAACRVGEERGVSWVGGSLIAGPDGYPLAGPAGASEPELLVADCDLARARDKATSPRNDPHRDRRPALYG